MMMRAFVGAHCFRVAALGMVLSAALSALFCVPVDAAVETKAERAILTDLTNGTVLFEKNVDVPFEPGSMAKLMTLEVLFEALDKGTTTLETTYPVSEHAWRTGGAPARTTTMFAALKSEVPVADLIRGIMIQNANDACIIVAEGLSGSEAAFAKAMNERARELGMTHSTFGNATGLPGAETLTTARDLSILATHLIKAHPQLYRIFTEEAFTWNKIYQRNRMALFGHSIGIDGLKDGFADSAGHGVVSSSLRAGRRLVAVVSGLKDEDERDNAAVDLLRDGYDQFDTVAIFGANETVAEARVFGGSEGYVPLVSYAPVEMTLPHDGREAYRMRVVYEGPVPAPVKKGQRVGELRLYQDKKLVQTAPLFTAADIGIGRLDQRAVDGARELLFGWW
ncbi:D-alanyl-D-alanine carboxypeptidase (penicillin-binding protein 5/6) [Breoghania corrubedonensis]|uniref:serine-type D-Ala-D-Ala carboxypeptidase n=1 Tax=Breoghania corrubedonensis TaxID=665038 RepID=A0A2T5V906_9HYPH|nr:D-alanyl-D-alanine carboxypeptidase family protein [Breoghania corrubedonensis]PTW60233.1 D-alanyl-D-alanine carboxypeptidase (penicillin-binding protein 5/6) [Breoghania corrubedonensis]